MDQTPPPTAADATTRRHLELQPWTDSRVAEFVTATQQHRDAAIAEIRVLKQLSPDA